MAKKKRVHENVKLFCPDEQPEEEQQSFSIFEQTVVSKVISIYLNGFIGSPAEYAEMIFRIRAASENDIVEIHLNTPGGELDTGIQIINAIKSTAAHVITVLDSRAYSLGTLIFLSGDECHVHDNCTMMFHNFSSSTSGKGNEQQAELNAIIPWFNKLMKSTCYPFLTKDEIQAIVKGGDLWMDSDQIKRRLAKMNEPEVTTKKPKQKKQDTPNETPITDS